MMECYLSKKNIMEFSFEVLQFCSSQDKVRNTQFKILNATQNLLKALPIFMRNPIFNFGIELFQTSAIIFQRKEWEKVRSHSNLQRLWTPFVSTVYISINPSVKTRQFYRGATRPRRSRVSLFPPQPGWEICFCAQHPGDLC